MRQGRYGRLAIIKDVLGRPAPVLSRGNRVLTLWRILLGVAGSPLPNGERVSGGKPPMLADPTLANPKDRAKPCLTLILTVQASGECGHAVLASRRFATSLSPTREIRNPVNGRPWDRVRNIVASIPLLGVISGGAGN